MHGSHESVIVPWVLSSRWMLARKSVLTGDFWFVAANKDSILVNMRLGVFEGKRINLTWRMSINSVGGYFMCCHRSRCFVAWQPVTYFWHCSCLEQCHGNLMCAMSAEDDIIIFHVVFCAAFELGLVIVWNAHSNIVRVASHTLLVSLPENWCIVFSWAFVRTIFGFDEFIINTIVILVRFSRSSYAILPFFCLLFHYLFGIPTNRLMAHISYNHSWKILRKH